MNRSFLITFAPPRIPNVPMEDFQKLDEYLEDALWDKFSHTWIRYEYEEVPDASGTTPDQKQETSSDESVS